MAKLFLFVDDCDGCDRAIAKGRLAPEMRDDQAYLNSVSAHLDGLEED